MTLRIALQKSGRLTDPSHALIQECGIEYERYNGRLKLTAYNFPVEILLLRDDDIPQSVARDVVDAAIVGENTVVEDAYNVETHRRLGFGRCRLSIAVPRSNTYTHISDLQGKRIATSYPTILSSFLKSHSVNAEIHSLSGSVEIAPSIGMADAICDLVSSGSTLLSNGLKEVERVFTSEAVLISRTELPQDVRTILNKLISRIDAVQRAKRLKYIALNVPKEKLETICKILPGLKSPSILPMPDANWCSIHTVIEESNFWDLIDQLKGNGAEGILVMPIEKLIE
jgi:ATP phosphoribosyltransferase